MSRIAYVNGYYVSHLDAAVHVEDRGYQFADGIYEVCEVRDSNLIDVKGHLDRLERSASELDMNMALGRRQLVFVMGEICTRNKVRDGLIYIQMTRGVAPRNHLFPDADTPCSIVLTARSTPRAVSEANATHGVSVITVPDNRWDRVDIKTTSLLPNVMAKQKAKDAGAFEAWFVDDDGLITEGTSTNVWIVTHDNVLVTRDASKGILKGITREGVLMTAERLQLKVEERRFSVVEAQNAKESFITAATTVVVPVVKIDGKIVGEGTPGEISQKVRTYFHKYTAPQ
ncbi:MAG: D-amino-acid transaminase [Hyphomicrobiales bacterium]